MRACGETTERARCGGLKGVAAMWRRIQDAFALTDQGMKDFMRGAGFCALANLMLMLPIVVLYFVASDFIRYLDDPSVGLPGMALYAAGIVAGISRDVHGGVQRKRSQAHRHRGAFAPASALVFRKARFVRFDERYHEGLLRSGAPVLAHYAADFRHGRFDAGIRRYDVRVRLEAGGICSLAHSRGACGVASDCTHPEVAYREEERGIPFVCRWSAGIP